MLVVFYIKIFPLNVEGIHLNYNLVNMHAITYRQEYPTRDCHILSKKVFGHQKAESFS